MSRVRCPACRTHAGVPILWGMPTIETWEAVEAGDLDVVIGGCCVEDVTAACRACGHRWKRRWRTKRQA